MYKFNKMGTVIRFGGSFLVLTILLQVRSVSPQACSGIHNIYASESQDKILTSPGYPSQYPNNLDCTWIISASSGQYVNVTFTTIETEASLDLLEIRDGQFSSSSLLASYNGTKRSVSLVSSGSKLRISFTTDGSVTRQGFRASYRAYDTLPTVLPTTRYHSNMCGGIHNLYALESEKIITSPGYPSQYPDNLDCTWIISASSGQYVKITFATFETEASYDYVEIRDGQYSNSTLLAKYSAAKSTFSFLSSGTMLWIRFTTDDSNRRKGFRGFYRAFDTRPTTLPTSVRPTARYHSNTCSGTRYLKAVDIQDGDLTSPGYVVPFEYPDNLDCTWIISAPSGQHIKITFRAFETETNKDYVEIRDGQSSSSNLVAKYSGSRNIFSVVSCGSKLRIRFTTDGSIADKGFRAFYHAVDTAPTTRHCTNEEGLTIALSIVSALFFLTLIISLYCWCKRRKLRMRQQTSTFSQRQAGVEFQRPRVELESFPEQNEVSANAPIERQHAEETVNRETEPSASTMSIPDEPPPTYLQAVGHM